MKQLEIIVRGQYQKDVEALLDRVKVSGYTIVSDISGKGHHGLHEGHLMFNEIHSMVMIMTVIPEEKVDTVLAGWTHNRLLSAALPAKGSYGDKEEVTPISGARLGTGRADEGIWRKGARDERSASERSQKV